MNDPRSRLRDNPFYVLGVRPSASRPEIEREGQKLLGMLELGLAASKSYATPLGPTERTADKVRLAMNELRDPDKRALHEVWARLDPTARVDRDSPTSGASDELAWPEALVAFGYGAAT